MGQSSRTSPRRTRRSKSWRTFKHPAGLRRQAPRSDERSNPPRALYGPNQTLRPNHRTDADMSSPGFYHQHIHHQQNQAFPSPGHLDSTSYSGDYQTVSSLGGSMGGYGGYSLGLDIQDDMLWSAGMGYDLLHTNSRPDLGAFGLGMGLPDGRGTQGHT
jgi:hypothetical protein